LQQVWFSQLASTLMRSSHLLQVVLSDLSKLDIHRLDASCFINLQQAWFQQACCKLMTSTRRLQFVDIFQQGGKIRNLQQVCGVSGRVYVKKTLWAPWQITH
jgi:hypothetical protein